MATEVKYKKQTIKTGWIVKKSKHIKNYRKRWMVLKGYKLLCYKTKKFTENNESPTEVFDLSLHRYRVDKHDTVKQKFYLIDETMTHSRTFKAFSQKDRNEWVYKITQSITISREVQFDKLYVNVSPKSRKAGLSISATVESSIQSKSMQDLHDSESEESDHDFGGYNLNVSLSLKEMESRRRTVSKRKEDHIITQESFRNFRVESLTIDGDIPDFSDESSDEESKLETLAEGNEDSKSESAQDITINIGKQIESTPICITPPIVESDNNAIVEQLKVFGYDRNDIINAMDSVIDTKDINAIRDKLDESKESKQSEDSVSESNNKNRSFIEQQIIATEQTYFQGLHTLLNELILPMFDNGLVDSKYCKQIKSSLPDILAFHRNFLNELNNVLVNHNKTVIQCFNQYITQNKQAFIEINIKYVCDYQSICALFGFTFHGNIELDVFLRQKRKEMKPLSSLLLLPLQRVSKYVYSLNHLLKNTEEKSSDYKDINIAVKMMAEINKEIKERKEKIESMAQTFQIQEGLNGLKEPIIKENRTFVEQFIFIKKSIKHQRLFFLFNDIVVIANEKWKVKHILEVWTLDAKITNIGKVQTGIKKRNKTFKNKIKKKVSLPEFTLVSAGIGSAVYIGEDIKTINKFEKLIGKLRVKLTSDELRERNNTLGSLKTELGRQALLYQ